MRQFFPLHDFRRAVTHRLLTCRAWPALALLALGSIVCAQTPLKNVDVVQLYDGSALKIDFSLPAADHVSSLEVTANGAAVGKDKIKFTPADKLTGYHCAVLLLVDKTLGNGKDTTDKSREKLWKSVRETLGKFSAVAEQVPYQVGVATFSAGNMEMMAPMGSKKNIVDSAIEKIVFNGVSPELYLGTKRAIEWFSGIPAERKFIVLISDGISNDKVASQQDVVQAALKAKVHICTVGFPKSNEARDGVQRLDPLADETGGYPLRADGGDPKLPPDAESNLLKFMVSGGQAEIHVEGQKGPIHLDGKLQTEFGKLYTFTQQVEATLPTEAQPPAGGQTAPAPVGNGAAILGKLRAHWLLLALGIAALLLVVVGLLLSLRKPAEEPIPEPVPTYIPPPMESEDTQIPEPSARVYAWLVMLDAEETRFPITKAAVRIGRKADNDIVTKNTSVSSHHAEIIKRGDKFFIADLEASNGVFIKGKRVEKAPLADGDVIELGEVRLRFTVNSPAD